MPREFVYDGRQFPDPDPEMSVDDVRKMWADFLPELATAETIQNKVGEVDVIEFKKRVGVKGDEEEEHKLLCPLKFTRSGTIIRPYCERENCGWWISDNQSCAIFMIAEYT